MNLVYVKRHRLDMWQDYSLQNERICITRFFWPANSRWVFGVTYNAFHGTQLMSLSQVVKKKRTHYSSGHNKNIFRRVNDRQHVVAVVISYLEILNWEDQPTCCIYQTLPLPFITCSDRWYTAGLSSTSHDMKIPKV